MTYVEAQGSHSEGPTFGVKFNATNLKFPAFFFFFLKDGVAEIFIFIFIPGLSLHKMHGATHPIFKGSNS